MSFDRKYLLWALSYVVAGMTLGIIMAASHNHAQFVAHAHILLVGFALSFIYGVMHKLWLVQAHHAVAQVQFVLHQAATVSLSTGLILLYGNVMPAPTLDPILGLASIGVLLSALLMFFMVVKYGLGKS